MLLFIYVTLCCFFKYMRKKKPQRYNNPHRHARTALRIRVCGTEDEHMRKIKCPANACWCGEAGAQQHRCLRAAAHLPRVRVPTALASLRTSVWGKEGGFLPKVGDNQPCRYSLGVKALPAYHELHESHVHQEIDVSIDFLHQLVADNDDDVARAPFDFTNQY